MQVIRRPTVSDDGEVIACIGADFEIYVYSVIQKQIIKRIISPKGAHSLIGAANVIHWSPEAHVQYVDASTNRPSSELRWLLLGHGSRIIVFQVDLDFSSRVSHMDPFPADFVADYSFEQTLGQINTAQFLLNHERVIVCFETGVQCSIVSVSKLERSDLPNPKFADRRLLATADNGMLSAVLLRSKAQDQLAIFSAKIKDIDKPVTFSLGTLDAQEVKWSPNNEPVLAVSDSPAFGPKIVFYTALGHPLKQLDMDPFSSRPDHSISGPVGVGITSFEWAKSSNETTLIAVGDANQQILLREQNNKSMTTCVVARLSHDSTVDGTQYQIYQELVDGAISRQEIVMDLQLPAYDDVTDIHLNANNSLLASKIASLPKTLWLWNVQTAEPVALYNFQHEIRQILFHPSLPQILVIVTASKRPHVYVCYDESFAPQKVDIIEAEAEASISPGAKWRAHWSPRPISGKHPFLFSSSKNFQLGHLGLENGTAVFRSIWYHNSVGFDVEEDTVGVVDTPSRPGRNNAHGLMSKAYDDMTLGGVTGIIGREIW